MDSPNVARIVGGDMTVSDKIRALDAEGYPRADIARVLGKRYQHVRNVLEADKLHPPKEKPLAADPSPGVQDAGRHFESSQRLSVEAGGVVRLPPELLAVLQAKPGSVVIAEVQDDGVKLFSNGAAWDRVRALVKQFGIDPKRDLVAELIAERRAEAAQDD
ncbi:AbrB/MazE/SpoVT family DNA-binding domain-containing protein [Phenylobacterium sp.]|uniref:AbrB/MazE/SpoVT family DNA-binding domain-containing protein n=1 Tax=Phenylobacterium sp. TaxID=1871053 RepID=UPI002BD5C917|nr:AbrB/MazE/SpoVT family DNA-binding domain-containing protein [Phenylobacterium sp.]HLZ75678.1 AbrB/MazE/SpoVT family DNA-binding domain-containing protein [Phenylobacterium sp.]